MYEYNLKGNKFNKWEWNTYIDTQPLQYSKMNIKSQNLRQITRLNTSVHEQGVRKVYAALLDWWTCIHLSPCFKFLTLHWFCKYSKWLDSTLVWMRSCCVYVHEYPQNWLACPYVHWCWVELFAFIKLFKLAFNIHCKRGTYLCRTGELLESLYCEAFSGKATSRQQHWAVSVQKQPSNHSSVIGW